MTDPRTDRIAAEAARLLVQKPTADVAEAIRDAAASLRLRGVRLPTPGRVRRHAQALAMQALGGAGYARSVRAVLELAEEVMAGLEAALGDAATRLVGRGALGEIDGDARLHIRVCTRASLADLAAALVALGYLEPAFETVESRVGRLNRLRVIEEGVEVVLTRLDPGLRPEPAIDLFTGRTIDSLTLEELRTKIDAMEPRP